MNIAIVSPFNPSEVKDYITDGSSVESINVAASSVHSMVRGILKMGHQVSIFTSCSGPKEKIIEYHGTNVHIYVVQNKKSLFGLKTYPKLRKLISQHFSEFDVLHAQWTYRYAYAIIPFANRIPCFCSVRDWCPYIMTFPHPIIAKIEWYVNYLYFKKVMSTSSIIKISNSSYTKSRISNYLQTDDVPYIPNPIKAELIVDRHNHLDNTIVFIAISQSLHDERKNVPSLIKAFILLRNRYPEAVLKLIGDGCSQDFRGILHSEKDARNIEFLGKMSHNDVIAQLDQSTCLIHTAFEETFGNIFLEASARGIPSIGGHDAGGVPQVLDYGRAGCLCDVHDVQSIYNAMVYMIENSTYRQFITMNAIKKVKDEYMDLVVCQKLIDLYHQYISSAFIKH